VAKPRVKQTPVKPLATDDLRRLTGKWDAVDKYDDETLFATLIISSPKNDTDSADFLCPRVKRRRQVRFRRQRMRMQTLAAWNPM
jgi:hypothetical protein